MNRHMDIDLVQICAFILALTAILGLPAVAAEYYVDQKHPQASDNNSGTEVLPWTTIGKATQTATAGDTVWIKAGVYRETAKKLAHSGEYYANEIRYITLAAYGDDEVFIEGARRIELQEWQAAAGTKNVFFIPLPEDPNQVFVDGKRLRESLEVVVEDKPDYERATDRTETHAEHPLTDESTGKWLYDTKNKRLYANIGDGNPSANHLVEVSVHSFAIDLKPRPGTTGTMNTGIRLRGLTFNRLREGLAGYGVTYSIIEDCVVRQAGGFAGLHLRGTHNIIRRNTVLDSLHQGIYWHGSDFVLEDNLVVGAMQDPHIVGSAWEGVFKTNSGHHSTIRNNVVAEVPPSEHHSGGLGIWCDINSEYNAVYGNVVYRQGAVGVHVEMSQNASVVAYNTCFDNGLGIKVRNNSFTLCLGNYLFDNRIGIWYGSENRYPPMTGQRAEGNWLVNNDSGILVSLPAPLGWNAVSLDRNLYSVPSDGKLVQWGEKAYTDIETLRKETGQEIHGKTGQVAEDEIQVIKFRVRHSKTPEMLVPMVANPTLLRAAPSGASGYANRPYFWRQGDGSGLSLGVGVKGGSSSVGEVDGNIFTSYPNIPRLTADGGSYVAGIIMVMLGPDGRLLESHEGPGEKRWGIYVQGIKPDEMYPLGEGWWCPSLPTVAGTRYKISWRSLADKLEPAPDDPKSGPVVFVKWTNDTGQNVVRHYLWGVDDQGRPHGKLGPQGSYPWSGDSGEVVAPKGATRVAFFFGLRRCKGIVRYCDIYIKAF